MEVRKMNRATAIFVVSYASLSLCLSSDSRVDISQEKNEELTSVQTADSNHQGWTNRHLAKPLDLAIDHQNNLYISSIEKGLVFKLDTSGAITVVAGGGKSRPFLVGASATSVRVRPIAITVDREGNLYFADADSFRVFKIRFTGEIVAVAGKGDGTEAYSGDGGSALTAGLFHSNGLSIGPGGEVFILDGENNRIRKVSADGVITTVAGTGTKEYGGDGGPAISAHLNWPESIAVDGVGILFVADALNSRVRMIDQAGIITTIAGTGTPRYNADGIAATKAGLYMPESVAVDDKGNLFIADQNGRIRRVDKRGIISTVAGGGSETLGTKSGGALAIDVTLNEPFAVTVDHIGNLYVADWEVKFSKTRVCKIDESGIITIVVADGGGGAPLMAVGP